MINYLGIDLLSKDHALFANSFGETLFHELLLPLCVIGNRSSAGQRIIDKEGLDVDLGGLLITSIVAAFGVMGSSHCSSLEFVFWRLLIR